MFFCLQTPLLSKILTIESTVNKSIKLTSFLKNLNDFFLSIIFGAYNFIKYKHTIYMYVLYNKISKTLIIHNIIKMMTKSCKKLLRTNLTTFLLNITNRFHNEFNILKI